MTTELDTDAQTPSPTDPDTEHQAPTEPQSRPLGSGDIVVERIDDGRRAKLTCTVCRVETYVLLLPDGQPAPVTDVINALATAVNQHPGHGR